MKKTFFQGFTGLILAWTITSITYSQDSNSTAKLKGQSLSENLALSNSEVHPGSLKNELKINEVSARVIRSFNRDYKNVPAVKWIQSSTGLFAAYFTSENIQSWVYYNKKGIYEFRIRYYKEENLPLEVRRQVKISNHDFSIYLVTEINRNGKTAYVVKMENKTTWKTIKVVDGEMEITEEYLKA